MKKLLMVMMAAVAMTAVADDGDSYILYWMVGESYATAHPFEGVRLYASVDGDNDKGDSDYLVTAYHNSEYTTLSGVGEQHTDITSLMGGSTYAGFYLEFINYETAPTTTSLGVSEYVSIADLASYIDHIGDGKTPSAASIFSPTSFTAVPEPTSGLMLLLGLASLALKRRRS